jgi:hypothetical protein
MTASRIVFLLLQLETARVHESRGTGRSEQSGAEPISWASLAQEMVCIAHGHRRHPRALFEEMQSELQGVATWQGRLFAVLGIRPMAGRRRSWRAR